MAVGESDGPFELRDRCGGWEREEQIIYGDPERIDVQATAAGEFQLLVRMRFYGFSLAVASISYSAKLYAMICAVCTEHHQKGNFILASFCY